MRSGAGDLVGNDSTLTGLSDTAVRTRARHRLYGAMRRSTTQALKPSTKPGQSQSQLLEQNDEWAVSRRYMTLETLNLMSDTEPVSLPALPA